MKISPWFAFSPRRPTGDTTTPDLTPPHPLLQWRWCAMIDMAVFPPVWRVECWRKRDMDTPWERSPMAPDLDGPKVWRPLSDLAEFVPQIGTVGADEALRWAALYYARETFPENSDPGAEWLAYTRPVSGVRNGMWRSNGWASGPDGRIVRTVERGTP